MMLDSRSTYVGGHGGRGHAAVPFDAHELRCAAAAPSAAARAASRAQSGWRAMFSARGQDC